MIKSVVVETNQQFNEVLKNNSIDKIIISRDSFNELDIPILIKKIKSHNKLAYIRFERISRYEKFKNLRKETDYLLKLSELDGVLICNIDSLYYILGRIELYNLDLDIQADYSLNIYNKFCKDEIIGSFNKKIGFVAGIELNKYDIKEIGFDVIIIYTYVPNMISSNCIYLNTNKCTKGKNVLNNTNYFKDRYNKKVNFKTYCKYCYNKIFNFVPLVLYDKLNDLKDLNIKEIRYDFYFENGKEVNDVLNNNINTEFTRGYINKSLK